MIIFMMIDSYQLLTSFSLNCNIDSIMVFPVISNLELENKFILIR